MQTKDQEPSCKVTLTYDRKNMNKQELPQETAKLD
jgi:hypothetical protein